MTLGINAHRWDFLHHTKTKRYIEAYKKVREVGWRDLEPATTERQFRTAHEILTRLHGGQKGVLLADDVGLGKTTIAALCALVFAGSNKKVRILAPNQMMSRRWRQELELHLEAVRKVASHLTLKHAKKRLGEDVKRLTEGAIAISTHHKAKPLACDLLIIDEAHRTRSENSNLARRIREVGDGVNRFLILTATPFSIDPVDFARLLARIGGDVASTPMKQYAGLLDELWRGNFSKTPKAMANNLTERANAAVEALTPFVIRHGIDDLRPEEMDSFGNVKEEPPSPLGVSDALLEAMLHADRALEIARDCQLCPVTRRNDPRYHVGSSKLKEDLEALRTKTARLGTCDAAEFADHHIEAALRRIRSTGRHPKIEETIKLALDIADQGEKVLIFCDHHSPAVELACALADELRWPKDTACGPTRGVWRDAWKKLSSDWPDPKRRENFLKWLVSVGVQMQIGSWIGADLLQEITAADLAELLTKTKARSNEMCNDIAAHARELYMQLVDRESASTRAHLLQAYSRIPGTSPARVAAVCDSEPESRPPKYAGIFHPNQPDAVVTIFNSPFGPDILVTTDRLSEGIDLHKFCRHLIHHELDPSPVRTIQRNGRLRRVNSWAARTKEPIRIYYPSLQGTRDERLVKIMSGRIRQFNLLLGGVRAEISGDEDDITLNTIEDVLRFAREDPKFPRRRLAVPVD